MAQRRVTLTDIVRGHVSLEIEGFDRLCLAVPETAATKRTGRASPRTRSDLGRHRAPSPKKRIMSPARCQIQESVVRLL